MAEDLEADGGKRERLPQATYPSRSQESLNINAINIHARKGVQHRCEANKW